MIDKALFSCNRTDWETPKELYRELNEEFHFTLDPASTDKNALCAKHFTKQEDGLAQSWKNETVFCNPPYGRETGKWIKKSYEEAQSNGATVVMLIPARTDTKAFHDYIYGYAEIRFLRGRLHFCLDGVTSSGAPFPSMLVIYRPAVMCDYEQDAQTKDLYPLQINHTSHNDKEMER